MKRVAIPGLGTVRFEVTASGPRGPTPVQIVASDGKSDFAVTMTCGEG